jgi:hypothetical protein
MKRTLLYTVLGIALFFSNRVTAQYLMSGTNDSTLPKIEFGLKLGANLQTITGNVWDNSLKPAIAGGIYAGMHKNKIGVCIEVLAHTARYTSNGSAVIDSFGNKGDFRATYIDVPVLFEYNIFSLFWLQVGPQYSNLVSVKSLNNLQENGKVLFKSNEFSGVLGIEGRFPKNITGGLRAIFGLTDMNNQVVSTDAWQNRTLQLYIAYRIK